MLRAIQNRRDRIVRPTARLPLLALHKKRGTQPIVDDELSLPLRYIAAHLWIERAICRAEIMQFLIGILRIHAADEMQQLVDVERGVGHSPPFDLPAPHRRPPRKVAAQLRIRERVIGRKVLVNDAVIDIVVLILRHQARLL